MATISLRGYVREIDTLIESDQVDEAIAHCRHILSSFPKHLSTYRLLGKAYLESQRHGDAADVLQRVLSAVPDDFLAHLGLSIVREDEGNLDTAIWHMERAFETQPSNAAVQSELRRMYAVRDGDEPLKVQLTRGALARMYVKGNLYSQAITELRAALREDPQRPDLLVVLARAHALASQRLEAVETCSNILNKLPYCFEANQILAEILPGTERAEEARIYLDRVEALDPYSAFIPAKAPTSEQVPDSMVTIERLDWFPGEPYLGEHAQPDLITSPDIEVEKDAGEDEAIPAWLAAISVEAQTQKGEETPQEIVPPFEILPEEGKFITETFEELVDMDAKNMNTEPTDHKDLEQTPEGLNESPQEPTGKPEETPTPAIDLTSSEDEDEDVMAKGLTEGEIPEWLKHLAPFPEEGKRIDTGALPWLEKVPPGEEDNVATWLNETKAKYVTGPLPPPDSEEGAQIPDWLRSLIEEAPEGAPQHVEAEAEPMVSEPTPVSEAPEEEIPEAVSEPRAMDSMEKGPPDEEIPGWLREYEQVDQTEQEEVPGEEAEEIPEGEVRISGDYGEWTFESEGVERTAEEKKVVVSVEDQVQEPVEEETETPEEAFEQMEEIPREPEIEKAEIPPWLEDAAPEEAEILEEGEALPDWLFEIEEEAVLEGEEVESEVEPAEMEEEIILGDTQPIKIEHEEEATTEEQISAETVMYEGEEKVDEEVPERLSLEEEMEHIPEGQLPGEEDEEAAIAWLEELVAGRTSTEEEPSLVEEVSSEVSVEAAEEMAAAEDQEVETIEAAEEVGEEAVETPVTEEIPEWLQEFTSAEEMVEAKPEEKVVLEEPEQLEPMPVVAIAELPNLDEAWSAIENGDIEAAVRDYIPWIKAEKELERVIQELNQAVSRYPEEISLHEALGDAYVRTNQIQEALDAYTKAEELLG